jgi:hypothetical protein
MANLQGNEDSAFMTAAEYRSLLSALGATQAKAAKRLGISIRSSNSYANGAPIPIPTARLLRLLVLTDVEKAH